MKDNTTFERRQSADRMAAVLLAGTVAGVVASALVLLSSGWLPGVALLLVSLVTFALSRLFDVLGDLLARIGRIEARTAQRAKEKIPPA